MLDLWHFWDWVMIWWGVPSNYTDCSYPLFLTFLTDSDVLLSALVPQFFLRNDGTSILRTPEVFLCKVRHYRQHHCWIRNLSCIPLQPQWRLSLGRFGYNLYSKVKKAYLKCFCIFPNNLEQFFETKIELFKQKPDLALGKYLLQFSFVSTLTSFLVSSSSVFSQDRTAQIANFDLENLHEDETVAKHDMLRF